MARASMGYTRTVVGMSPEILYNSEYVGDAITLDTTAFTAGVCKAGSPITKNGTVSNTSSAIGLLLYDVYEDRPQGTVVIGGYINTEKAQEHSGVTVDEEAKTAMKNVVFC